MLVASTMMSTMAWAETYDKTELTSGDKTIALSCLTDGNGNYQMIIEGEGLTGLGGSFAFKDGVGGYDVRSNMTVSSDNTSIVCNWTSTSNTYLHTPLYVMMPGEVNFGELSIDWKTVDELAGVGAGSGSGSEVETPQPEAPQSSTTGNIRHFASATMPLRGIYTITADASGITYTVTGEEAINFAEIQFVTGGGVGMTISEDKKTATYKQTGVTAGADVYFRFLINVGDMAGNEMTAETLSKTDANIFYYKYEVESTPGEGEGGSEETPETPARVSQLTGDIKHFAPDNATVRATYKITADASGNVTFTVYANSVDFAEIQVLDKGNYAMTAASDKSYASYTFSDIDVNTALYFRFLVRVDDMPGNEMTAETLSTTDAKVFYYVYEGATPAEGGEGEGDTPTAIGMVTTSGVATVYDITGKIVKKNVDAKSALNGLSRGTYIVKTANSTKKAVVR